MLINGDIDEALYTIREYTQYIDEDDVSKELLMKLNKAQLTECLLQTMRALLMSRDTLIGATSQFDVLKDTQITLQKQIIDQKDELLKSKTEQLAAVQTTVKTELRSYCEAATTGLSDKSITAAQVKLAVKSAVEEEDRTRNLMMFGVPEHSEETLETQASVILEQVEEKPRITDCYRIGMAKEGATRPIKVTLSSSDGVQRVLRKAGLLKKSENLKRVYLAADRTMEERTARNELVKQLKQKRETEPGLYHFIRNGVILSRNQASVTKND